MADNMLILPILPDTKAGDKALQAWKEDIQKRLKVEIQFDADKAKQGLKGVTDQADKTAKAAEGILAKLNAQAFVGAIGPVKEIFGQLGTSLFGINQEMVQFVTRTADLAEKGAQVGAAFGPVGSLVGALGGALLSATEALQKLKAELPETTVKLEELVTGAEGGVKNMSSFGTVVNIASLALGEFGPPAEEVNQFLADMGPAGMAATQAMKGLGLEVKTVKEEAEKLASVLQEEDLLKAYENSTYGPQIDQKELAARQKRNAINDAAKAKRDAEAQKAADKAKQERDKEFAALQRENERIYNEKQKAAAEIAKDLERIQKEALSSQLANEQEALAKRNELSRQESEERIAIRLKEIELEELWAKQEEERIQAKTDALTGYLEHSLTVFSAVGAQVEANIANNEKLLSGVGAATEAAFGSILKGIGRESAVLALKELAAGVANSLVAPPIAGSHFAAAGIYGAAAAAAGITGVALSGDAARRQGEASAGGSTGGASAGGSSGRMTDPGPTQMASIVVNFDSTVPATEREAQVVADRLTKILGSKK